MPGRAKSKSFAKGMGKGVEGSFYRKAQFWEGEDVSLGELKCKNASHPQEKQKHSMYKCPARDVQTRP